ncbi:hypothetical protein F5X99DRAFT_392068 [Biscogniauxia marginata]|nr:hypothetical protein F5X99DRAFT_392068 [Biscogniauxia marginata]
MPHHRHRHPKRADKYPVGSLDHRRLPNTRYQVQNDSLSPGRLNRVLEAPNGHDAVESWLGGVAAHVSHPRPRSPGFREEAAKDSRRQLLQDTTPRKRGNSERVDLSWRPNHILHMEASHSSPRQQHLNHEKRLKRPKHRENDSSLISGFGNSTQPSEIGLVSALCEREHTSPSIPLGEGDRSVAGDSSPMSHLDELAAFERRPRRKTREDKYDTKKKGSCKHETNREESQHNHRTKRIKRSEKKRKAAMPSKNVMNNFNSHAVLNDRITVQPTFKPGLFENGRLSKGQPIPDLAFSDMQFLKHQKRESQPKPLSRSRLRERRRENREIEQVSSFFLPSKAERRPKGPAIPTREDDRNAGDASKQHERDLITHSHHRNLEVSSSRHSPITLYHGWSPSSYDRICPLPTHNFSGSERRQASSKATSYFTWSSSHQSPRQLRHDTETGSYFSDSTKTVTPEPVKKALVATGVYKDTGIYPYDDSTSKQKEDTAHCISTSEHNPSLVSHHDWSQQESSAPPAIDSRAEVTVTDDNLKALEQRWNAILPPEWRPGAVSRDVLPTEKYQANDLLEEKDPQFPQDSKHVDPKDIAGMVRIEPSRTNTQNYDSKSSNTQVSGTDPNHNTENTVSTPLRLRQNVNDQIPGSQDRTSQTSREAMPPPPLPIRINNTMDKNTVSNIGFTHNSARNCAKMDGTEDKSRASLGNTPVEHVQDLDDSRNASASSPRPNTDTERTNSSLGLLSWIPQTRTPSIVNDERCNILSRMSMGTPIYQGLKENYKSRFPLRIMFRLVKRLA